MNQQNASLQNVQILPNTNPSGTVAQVQQASIGGPQVANVRQLLARNTNSGQPIRIQQVGNTSNVIRLVNQGNQPTGQIMIQNPAGGNIRLAPAPQNQAIRLVNANQQPRQTFVISQPATQTTQGGVLQNNVGQIRLVNLGGNQLASLAGLQVRQPVQGQVRVSSSVPPGQTSTSIQQPVNIQVSNVQQPMNIQVANNVQNSGQIRLQTGLQTTTPMIIKQPVTVQQMSSQKVSQQQLITQTQNQVTIQQPSQTNQNLSQIQTAQNSIQKPQQIVVNTGQVSQQALLQQLANQQRKQGQTTSLVQVNTAQPTNQTSQVIHTQKTQSSVVTTAPKTLQIGTGKALIQQTPQQNTQPKVNVQIAPSQTIVNQLGQPQTLTTAPSSATTSTIDQVRIAPTPITSTSGQTIVTIPNADSNSTITVKSVSHPNQQGASGQAQESKVIIGQPDGAPTVSAKIIQKAALPPGVKVMKNPLQNIDIPAQIQKMQVALEHIMKIANTPENQPKIQDIQVVNR